MAIHLLVGTSRSPLTATTSPVMATRSAEARRGEDRRHRVRTALQLRPGRHPEGVSGAQGFYSYGYSRSTRSSTSGSARPTTSTCWLHRRATGARSGILMPSVITKYDWTPSSRAPSTWTLSSTPVARWTRGSFSTRQSGRPPYRQLHGPVHRWGGHRRATTGGAARTSTYSESPAPRRASRRRSSIPGRHHLDDLLTFAAITTANSNQRLTAVNGITVNSHVRASWTISGTTPAFNALIGFSRSVVYT